MNKKVWLYLLRAILICLICFWLLIIFCFSAQGSQQSGQASSNVTQTIIDITYPNYSTLDSQTQTDIFQKLHLFIRKFAHFFNFFILGILSISFLSTYKIKKAYSSLISSCFCLLYAISDEIHQIFIPGRAGLVSDVCIDFFGSLLGIGITLFIFYLFLYRQKKRQKIA